jgi:hypothetical protein
MAPFANDEEDFNHSIGSFDELPSRKHSHCYADTTKMSVRFASSNNLEQVHYIPHIKDMSASDIEKIWMTQEEQEESRRQSILAIMDLDKTIPSFSSPCSSSMTCFRGLEQSTQDYMQRKLMIVQQLLDTVAAIQEFESTVGMKIPPEFLADACQQLTAPSITAAMVRGIKDASEVTSMDAHRRRQELSSNNVTIL